VVRSIALCLSAVLALLVCSPPAVHAQSRPIALAATPTDSGELRTVDQQVDRMIRDRELQLREVSQDKLVPGRQHQRLDQYVRGVRIFGGDLTRQMAADGTVSVFGMLHGGVEIDTGANLSVEDARRAIVAAVPGELAGAPPECDTRVLIEPHRSGQWHNRQRHLGPRQYRDSRPGRGALSRTMGLIVAPVYQLGLTVMISNAGDFAGSNTENVVFEFHSDGSIAYKRWLNADKTFTQGVATLFACPDL
jgi:hypothetical protein